MLFKNIAGRRLPIQIAGVNVSQGLERRSKVAAATHPLHPKTTGQGILDEGIHHPDQAGLVHVIVQRLGQ